MDEMIEVLARYRYNAKHDADRIKALEDELSRLRASSFVTAVPAEDYEKMKAEVERLTLIVGADAIDREHGMCCDASAQVKRLTKAGDAMAKTIGENGVHDNGSFLDVAESIDAWHAAKKGGQS